MKTAIKKNCIILIATSINQILNFLSYFSKNNLIYNRKIVLIIFSDFIPQSLIFEFSKLISRFGNVEVIKVNRNSLKTKKKFLLLQKILM